MEFINHHLRKAILSDVDDVTCAAKDGDADWEYIDARIAELGTIGHGNVDIGKIQEHAVLLLSKTKDMRVVTHLLRTLQHGKKPNDIALAFTLLADYIEKYWANSAPSQKLKLRLLKQIIQRFLQAKPFFISESTTIEREIAALQLQRIQDYFTINHLPVDDDFKQTVKGYTLITAENRADEVQQDIDKSIPESRNTQTETAHLPNPEHPVTPPVNINQHTDQDWKRTLIKVSEILFERSPGEPIAFQLRRHAIFSTLSEPINLDGIIDLPPQNADRVAEYKSLSKPTQEQWLKLENSLTVMPWWLEGHYISAQFATRLGFSATADAIKLSLQQFIARLPTISTLCFKDKSRLITPEMETWLQHHAEAVNRTSETDTELFECLDTQGYEAALRQLNTQPPGQEMRQQYHQQKLNAQLLSQAGFGVLAAQQAQSLIHGSQHLSIEQWEPSFFAALNALTTHSR
ncbi:MAG: type VI secretion system protein TssA [Enterobacteriaceae bacterium]|jgi:type VI secretion system protein VasJ|nr:type VI secretion system protein TssA [Enterobacteriaceae bacterium]